MIAADVRLSRQAEIIRSIPGMGPVNVLAILTGLKEIGRLNGKEAAALMVARQDRELPFVEQMALRLHLAVCDACPRFERQLDFMRRAFGRWRHQAGDDGPAA